MEQKLNALQAQLDSLYQHCQSIEQRYQEELAELQERKQRENLERFGQKLDILLAKDMTGEEAATKVSLCTHCRHAELQTSYAATYKTVRAIGPDGFPTGESTEELTGAQTYTLVRCSKDHLRVVELPVASCTLYSEEPGLTKHLSELSPEELQQLQKSMHLQIVPEQPSETLETGPAAR